MAKDMTKGSPMKLLIAFSASILTSSLLSFVYNATDSAMVSRFVNMHALGAISSITPMTTLIQSVFLALLSGFTISVGRASGKGDSELVRRLCANGTTVGALVILPVVLLSCVLTDPIMTAMDVPEAFMSDARAYYLIIILALPISGIQYFCSGLFTAFGDSRTPMLISVSCGTLNVAFNYLFLAVIPLGVAGAALGTVLATAVGMTIHLIVLLRSAKQVRFGLSDMRPRRDLLKTLLNDGTSLAILNLVITASSAILQRAVNGFSPEVITGVAVGSRLVTFVWMIICAIESALIYYCSQNDGAGEIGRIKSGIRSSVIITLVAGGVLTAALLIFGEPFIRIFLGGGTDAESLATLGQAQTFLNTQLAFFPFMVLLASLRGAVKGMGNAIPTVACGVIELVARVAVAMISGLSTLGEELKIRLLYFAAPAAWIAAVILLAVVMGRVFKKRTAELNSPTPAAEETTEPTEAKA